MKVDSFCAVLYKDLHCGVVYPCGISVLGLLVCGGGCIHSLVYPTGTILVVLNMLNSEATLLTYHQHFSVLPKICACPVGYTTLVTGVVSLDSGEGKRSWRDSKQINWKEDDSLQGPFLPCEEGLLTVVVASGDAVWNSTQKGYLLIA